MTVYTSPAPSATVTWPEPIEPVWQMLSGHDTLAGYKRPDLSLADRLFIGAVVNLPCERRPWGSLTWLAQVFATSRVTVYAIGERTRQALAALPSGRPARLPAPAEAESSRAATPVIAVTPNRLARTILTLLMPGGVSERTVDDCLRVALDQGRSVGFVSELLHTVGQRAG